MKTIYFLLVLFFTYTTSQAQYEFVKRKSRITLSGTIAKGWMTDLKTENIYFSGYLEYFPEENISFRGENHLYIGTPNEHNLYDRNDALSFAGIFHFTPSPYDLYAGFQPGVNINTRNTNSALVRDPSQKVVISPTFGITAGFTFFLNRYLNFFVCSSYIYGTSYETGTNVLDISEVTLKGGLGFGI